MQAQDSPSSSVDGRALHTHLRELIFVLCKECGLPVLVTDLIADHLHGRDLLAVNRLSRAFYDLATKVIYNTVVLDFTDPERWGLKAAAFLRTLLTNSTAAAAVRSLSLIGDPLSQWKLECRRERLATYPAAIRRMGPPKTAVDISLIFGAEDVTLYQTVLGSSFVLDASLSKLCLDIMRLTKHLQLLRVDSYLFRFVDFQDGLHHLSQAGAFESLRNVTLCQNLEKGSFRDRRLTAVKYWNDALLIPFFAPGMESIAAVTPLRPQAVSRLHTIRRLYTTSITRLTLHHVQVRESDLCSILAATPRLRCLEYHAYIRYSSSWPAAPASACSSRQELRGLEHVFAALHHVSDSLEKLVTSQKIEHGSLSFKPNAFHPFQDNLRHIDELARLEKLHTLSIPYLPLFGFTPEKKRQREWSETLPSSLRHITLTDDLWRNWSDDSGWSVWTEEGLLPAFTGLLDYLASPRPCIGTPGFALLLDNVDDGFAESAWDVLYALCEERGINCSIKRTSSDAYPENDAPL